MNGLLFSRQMNAAVLNTFQNCSRAWFSSCVYRLTLIQSSPGTTYLCFDKKMFRFWSVKRLPTCLAIGLPINSAQVCRLEVVSCLLRAFVGDSNQTFAAAHGARLLVLYFRSSIFRYAPFSVHPRAEHSCQKVTFTLEKSMWKRSDVLVVWHYLTERQLHIKTI